MEDAISFSCCLTLLQWKWNKLVTKATRHALPIPPGRHDEQHVGEITIGQGEHTDQGYKRIVVLHENGHKVMLAAVREEQAGHKQHACHGEQQAGVLIGRQLQPARQ